MAIDYTKLTEDLRVALAAAGEAADCEDGGTCNLDSLVITLKGARVAKVQQAAQDAGAYYASKGYRWPGEYTIGIPTGGQANRRTRAVEAAKRSLQAAGWSAHVSYVID